MKTATKSVKATPAVKAEKAKAVAKAQVNGTVLKKAFPDQDADGLKLIRRHLRKALRRDENPQFRFHKIGTRWVFPTTRDVSKAREEVKPYLS